MISSMKVPVKKLIKKQYFFPFQTIPICDKRRQMAPLTAFILGLTIIAILSVITNILVYYFWPRVMHGMIVSTNCAKLIGYEYDEIYNFESIPYSLSPTIVTVGVEKLIRKVTKFETLRWKESQLINCIEECAVTNMKKCIFNNSLWWCKIKKPTTSCLNFQIDKISDGNSSFNLHQKETEDCLYLSIKVPKTKPKKAPVVVFISGTNYAGEYTSQTGFESPIKPSGAFINEVGAIFVTVNYRMGIFGTFFNDKQNFINFSVSDLLAAFKWIRKNIAKFGGDIKNINLFGHGTGATLGLNILLSKIKMFRSAWLASGSIHIPRTSSYIYQTYKALIQNVDKRCKSESFFRKYCHKYYFKILKQTSEKLNKVATEFYNNQKTLSNLLDFSVIAKNEEVQPPLLIIDKVFIKDSPIYSIYKNSLNPISLVFSSVSGELDGFPGSRELHFLTKDQVKNGLRKVFKSIFKLSKISNPNTYIYNLLSNLFKYAQHNKMTLSELVVEIISYLRVTCPYYWIASKMRKANLPATIYNVVHTQSPATPVKNLIFDGNLKTTPFFGFDIVMLFKRQKIYTSKVSNEEQLYQDSLIKVFRNFVTKHKIVNSDYANKTMSLNDKGLKTSFDSPLAELCERLDYTLLAPFLSKIN